MDKELKDVIELIETSTGKTARLNHTKACRTLLAISTEKKRLERIETILKTGLIGSEKLPFTSPEGEIREETTSEYVQDIKAIRKELPKDVFYGACSIVKSRIKDRKHVTIVEKNTSLAGQASPYIKIYPATKVSKLDVKVKIN